MKYILVLLLLTLLACHHTSPETANAGSETPLTTATTPEPALESPVVGAQKAATKQLSSRNTVVSSNKAWRDRINSRPYPRPDSIGGKPVGFYLTNPKVSPLAKALYTAHFRPSDNDSTTQLLALVTTNDGRIRPFYRWCLDFTIAIADGALGEYPGEPALAYATKFPQEFFAYMDKDATGARYRRWVESIAYSGLSNYEASEPATRKAITKAMTKQCMACANQTVDRINTFAQDVATSAQRNNQ